MVLEGSHVCTPVTAMLTLRMFLQDLTSSKASCEQTQGVGRHVLSGVGLGL